MWMEQVFLEYGPVLKQDLYITTLDGGSGIKQASSVILGDTCPWDWCILHLYNCALVDAFGTSKDPQKSKNKDT